ncbi:hypothetical protein GQ55_5G421500 [Panicum hallii var. hallii]|uniref:Uncharacterized protein n=1 Tax=Panicum hallii var. hallii TaxID=1504633 RepID=A0A2T7DP47_9POAL|nr:hypothetical protein GQ55_5G421500 [Panicum hallii var. hallii]
MIIFLLVHQANLKFISSTYLHSAKLYMSIIKSKTCSFQKKIENLLHTNLQGCNAMPSTREASCIWHPAT